MWMQRRKLSITAGEKYKILGSQDASIFHVLCIKFFSCMGTAYFFFNPSLWFLTLWQVHKCYSSCFFYSQQVNESLVIFMIPCLLVMRKTSIFSFMCWRGLGHCSFFCPERGKWIIKINILLFNPKWILILVHYWFILCIKQNKTKQNKQIFCLLCVRPFKCTICHKLFVLSGIQISNHNS